MRKLTIVAGVLLALGAGTLCAGSLPSVDLAKADATGFDTNAWSAVQTVDGVACRTVLKGQTGRVLVDAWWSEKRLRPPEDTIYVLEVKYKDTGKTPVVFLTHGANGAYNGPAEVHRFGGEGDGVWKTARLPFGWDQIIRLLSVDPAQEKYGQTAFLFRSMDSDLPIASLTVSVAAKADETAYNEETRAWVAKAQAGLRRQNPVKVEPRKFKLKDEQQAVVAFAWPSMLTLMPEAQPRDGQVGGTVRLRACLGEMEPGSFGVYANGLDLTGLDYAVSDLRDDKGRVFAGEVIRRTAEYSMVQIDKRQRLIPQRFWPAFKATVPGGQSQWLWFNVQTLRGTTRPGVYRGMVTVTCDQGKAELPVELEVLAIDLPTMDECGFVAGGCLGNQVPLHDIAFQKRYNQNAVSFFNPCSPAPMTRKDGQLRIDFRCLDDWYAGARKRGCEAVVYFCGGDPYGFPETLHVQRDLARLGKSGEEEKQARIAWGKAQDAAPERILPEVRPLFKEWIKLMHDQSLKAGWPEVIFSPFDEPAKWAGGGLKQNAMGTVIGAGPWLKPFFKDCAAAMHEVDPKLRVYASIHHNIRGGQSGVGEAFIPDVDVFCANCIHEDAQLGDKVRAGGKTFWQYTGAGAASSLDQGRYSFGFFFGSFDSRGGLVWAYNLAGFDTSGAGEQAVYAWQTPFDTIPAPWFEGYREGWDDRRVIEAYKRKFAGNPEKMKILDDIFMEVKAVMNSGKQTGGRDTVSDFWNAIDDSGRLDAWRNRLLDELARGK